MDEREDFTGGVSFNSDGTPQSLEMQEEGKKEAFMSSSSSSESQATNDPELGSGLEEQFAPDPATRIITPSEVAIAYASAATAKMSTIPIIGFGAAKESPKKSNEEVQVSELPVDSELPKTDWPAFNPIIQEQDTVDIFEGFKPIARAQDLVSVFGEPEPTMQAQEDAVSFGESEPIARAQDITSVFGGLEPKARAQEDVTLFGQPEPFARAQDITSVFGGLEPKARAQEDVTVTIFNETEPTVQEQTAVSIFDEAELNVQGNIAVNASDKPEPIGQAQGTVNMYREPEPIGQAQRVFSAYDNAPAPQVGFVPAQVTGAFSSTVREDGSLIPVRIEEVAQATAQELNESSIALAAAEILSADQTYTTTVTEEPIEVEEEPLERGITVITREATVLGDILTEGHIDIVGRVKGNIDAKGDVAIHGIVRGDVGGSKIGLYNCRVKGNLDAGLGVIVDDSSIIGGDVKTKNIIFDGKVKGNIDAENVVVLRSHSYCLGDVSASSLAIEPGAVLNGKVKTFVEGDLEAPFYEVI